MVPEGTVITTGVPATGATSGVTSTEPVAKVAEPVVTQPPSNLPKTQEEMDAIIRDRLARAQESFKKDPAIIAAMEAKKKLDELARTGMSEPEKLTADLKAAQEQIDKINRENAELKATQLKQSALSKANLPLTFAERLHGITEDEIAADLVSLTAQLKAMAQPSMNLGGGTNPAAGAGSSPTLDQQIEEATKKGDILLAIKLKNQRALQSK
jgi:Fe2+ transport system protein B